MAAGGTTHVAADPTTGTIRLSRTVPQMSGTVWHALVSPAGTGVWLGKGAELGGKGERYACDDGSTGVVRSYHPLEQLRLSWHATATAEASLVELDLTPLADGTQIRLWHENVPPELADGIRAQWELRMDALVELLADTEPGS
jgi:uncharacterized protein YndB with AHSA1/START domain